MLWDERHTDFGRNCLATYRRNRRRTAEGRPDGATTTEISFDIATCLAIFVVLHAHELWRSEERRKSGSRPPTLINRAGYRKAVDDFVDTTFGEEADAPRCLRHALAHFHVHAMPAQPSARREIRGVMLESYSQNEETKRWDVLKWRGEITGRNLEKLLGQLQKLWPTKKRADGPVAEPRLATRSSH
jgi:hypothetical protein